MTTSLRLAGLVFQLRTAVIAAPGSYQANKRRLELLERVGGVDSALGGRVPLIAVKDPEHSLSGRLAGLIERILPVSAASDSADMILVQAGFESAQAPAIYALLRLASALAIPGLACAFGPHDTTTMLLVRGGIGIALGLWGPSAVLSSIHRRRQDRIRK